ncbi:MAG TPA: DUF5715 family protein [Candidatus Binatia bacterium]|nr:DUF5715 family protein [Candidatus Binatia bacterium]
MHRVPLAVAAALAMTITAAPPAMALAASQPEHSTEAAAPRVARPKIIDVPGSLGRARSARDLDRERLQRELTPELVRDRWIEDYADLERAYRDGELVEVASDPTGVGIELRLEGPSRIGELEQEDSVLQTLLCRAAPATVGLLYRIADRIRLIEGEAYEPLIVTSLVRTWDYQQRLTMVNPNADKTRDGIPPTHVLGLAFDLSRRGMSDARQRRLESVLDELSDDGEVVYYKEGAGHDSYHVIAMPNAHDALTRYWQRLSGQGQQRVASGERHREHALPVPPCVVFGASLEPYSAVCTCDLPADAGPVAGDGG